MSTGTDKPTVLIVGAGLGGLMLGALLEKQGVPYTIFERAATVKPLGSAMAIGSALLPAFQQMGIYDDFLAIGKYYTRVACSKQTGEDIKAGFPLDIMAWKTYSGYDQYIVARPMLYELILKQVPAHKIRFGKKVLNISEKDDKVTVHLTDDETFEGDIIVGADGAYSAVRQSMYEQLKAKGKLPKLDQEELSFNSTCLVGQTKVLDPKEFPEVALPFSNFTSIQKKGMPYSWSTLNTAQGTMCWLLVKHLEQTTTKSALEQRNKESNNTEWGGQPVQTMLDETRDLLVLFEDGKVATLGDLYDLTATNLISKVMIEEKVFTTWHHDRYVLLGDACHKLDIAGGQGAVTAMHDAIALANLIYAMPTTTTKDVTEVFEEYKAERYPAVMESYNNSKQLRKLADPGLLATIISFIVSWMPMWLWNLSLKKGVRFRPQIGYLSDIEQRGTYPRVPSPSELKARAVFKKRQQAAASV
ncbi:hypothetical protein BGX24_001084 [Mortierella sp. AD032]|nr:hypothetical protein BGX24_001084 [Mortierella sp. AD032]